MFFWWQAIFSDPRAPLIQSYVFAIVRASLINRPGPPGCFLVSLLEQPPTRSRGRDKLKMDADLNTTVIKLVHGRPEFIEVFLPTSRRQHLWLQPSTETRIVPQPISFCTRQTILSVTESCGQQLNNCLCLNRNSRTERPYAKMLRLRTIRSPTERGVAIPLFIRKMSRR